MILKRVPRKLLIVTESFDFPVNNFDVTELCNIVFDSLGVKKLYTVQLGARHSRMLFKTGTSECDRCGRWFNRKSRYRSGTVNSKSFVGKDSN